MKTKLAISVLLLAVAVTLACNASKVSMYVNLAVDSVKGGISLAQSYGANISADAAQKVSTIGTDLENSFSAWASASATDKPGKWAAVQTALNSFKTYLPQVLNDAGVDPKYTAYAGIASLAITAVEAAVNLIEAQNAPAGTQRCPIQEELQPADGYSRPSRIAT
jgi:hypothetical protein